jgi:2-polyprenyl-3-methyl-5-hydroxy-6-metoxy-1,4-benzoquinol methylase
MNNYMYGLALTTYLWPNHLKIKRFFLNELPRKMVGNYLEIGPGHGLNFQSAISTSSFSRFVGLDISPSSLELTRRVLEHVILTQPKSYDLILSDFLTWVPNQKFEAVVMGEVLEHVEEPLLFLKKISSLVVDSSFIFVTTCIDAPAVDHIYHYSSFAQIEDHVNQAGLSVQKKVLLPYGNLTLGESLRRHLAVNVALVLEVNRE